MRDRKPHGHLTIEPRRVHCCKELEETVSGRSAELLAINDRLAEEINARKKVEAALLASEERYRRVFENTGNATILIESDMTISMANARAEKLVGIPREKFLGKPGASILSHRPTKSGCSNTMSAGARGSRMCQAGSNFR